MMKETWLSLSGIKWSAGILPVIMMFVPTIVMSAHDHKTDAMSQIASFEQIARQAVSRSEYDAVVEMAQKALSGELSSRESDSVVAQVRKSLMLLVKNGTSRNGRFDLSSLIINSDFSNGSDGWRCDGYNVSVNSNGIAAVYGSKNASSISQLLEGMPAGDYTLVVQSYYRPTTISSTISRYLSGEDEKTAFMFVKSNDAEYNTPVKNILDGGRYSINTTTDFYSTPDGRSVPNSMNATSMLFAQGQYWNVSNFHLADDGEVTIGIKVGSADLSGNMLVADNFRLLYGSLPVITMNHTVHASVKEATAANVILRKTLKAGRMTPLCLPFDIDKSQLKDHVFDLYAIGGISGTKAYVYSTNLIKAGQPFVACSHEDMDSVVFDSIVITPEDIDVAPLRWDGGTYFGNYEDFSWSFTNIKDAVSNASRLSFVVLDWMNMDFSINLENLNARKFINNNTYTSEMTSVIENYNMSPVARRDIPNPVTIPIPHNSASKIQLTYWADDIDASTRNVAVGTAMAVIPNLIPQKTYFYKVTADGSVVSQGQFHTTGRLRMIYAPSVSNIRDLGGWPTDKGARVNYGYVYRGGELNGDHIAALVDKQVLTSLGIGAEIDLRWLGENSGAGISAFGFAAGDDTYYFADGNDWSVAHLDEEIPRRHWKEEFEMMVRNLRLGRSVYFHCIWGADRTGMFGFLLDGLLGLTQDSRYKDYELTSFSIAGYRYKDNYEDRVSYFNSIAGATVSERFQKYFREKLKVKQDDINFFLNLMLGENRPDDIKASPAAGTMTTEERTYTIQGHRVTWDGHSPLPKGMYIINNKKTIVK